MSSRSQPYGIGFFDWFGRRSFRNQLILLVLATALPLLGISALMFRELVGIGRESLRRDLMVSAKTLAALVDNEIDTHTAIASTLAASPNLQKKDLDAFWIEARQALKFVPGAWLAVSTPDGQIVMNTLAAPGTAFPRHARPDVIQTAFSARAPQLGDLVVGPVAKRLTGFVEVPVFSGGAPLFSISVALSPARFLKLIQGQFAHGEVVGILDRNRRFVARVPDSEARLGTVASEGWRKAIDAASEGWTETATVEGDLATTAYAPTRQGWIVGVAQLQAQTNAPFQSVLRFTALGSAGLLLLSGALAFMVAWHTSRGVTMLARSARELASGKAFEAPPAPFAEAVEIGSTLVFVSDELQKHEAALARGRMELEAELARRSQALEAEGRRRAAIEDQLRQSQKMEALGQLTGGVAHDFNNMLAIIIGSLRMVERRLVKGDTDIMRFIDHAVDGAMRATTLTQRLLAFSRQQPLVPSVLDASALVRGMSDLLRRSIGEDIKLEIVQAGGLWRTAVDAGQLEQVIVNLAINSRDAMPQGGRLTIETYNAALDDEYSNQRPGVPPGQYVVVAVSDTGVGMPPDVAARAFDPFFTTKGVGKGTGLGLSQVFGFAQQSGGLAKIYSELGHGTSVKLYFPRHHGPDTARPEIGAPSEEFPRGTPDEHILVVEDEEKLRALAVEVLRDLGYMVTDAPGGREALAIIDKLKDVTLLFTDVVMPDMNGRELANELGKIKPGVKVLYTTGYARNAIVHGGKLDPGVHLLEKPFTISQLAIKVRRVLEEHAD